MCFRWKPLGTLFVSLQASFCIHSKAQDACCQQATTIWQPPPGHWYLFDPWELLDWQRHIDLEKSFLFESWGFGLFIVKRNLTALIQKLKEEKEGLEKDVNMWDLYTMTAKGRPLSNPSIPSEALRVKES